MNTFPIHESLNRVIKQSLDSGEVSSLPEAEAMFRGYRLCFAIDNAEAHDPIHQATLLTGVALARRVFLGGVSVIADSEVPLSTPLPLGRTLGDAIVALGGVIRDPDPETPLVHIGGGPRAREDRFHVRTITSGWRGGVAPAHSDLLSTRGSAMPPTAMLAAGLAVNEAFLHVRRESNAAGRRAVGLSLWNPSPACDWLSDANDGPKLIYLPTRLWLIGLGHLGQAYLWGLGLLPYSQSSDLSLVLQDVDVLTPASESTSILTEPEFIGQKKTRALAAWSERRGFQTSIHERFFDANHRRQDVEPEVALCGLDNALGRRALDDAKFGLVVEAGLGRGYRDFRTIRMHTLPGARPATQLWKEIDSSADLSDRTAYQQMLGNGELDRCGVTLLAGKAVGAPFVGAVAASLVLSEVLRHLHGGPLHQVIDLDLQSVDHRSVVGRTVALATLNPGFVLAAERQSA